MHRIGNERVDQTVYIPYPEDLGAIALNQRDNGYGTNMTVGVAIEYGEVIG